MHLSPRDVLNYLTATGTKLATREFERFVNVFRFIIPQRRWLMDKINNQGYTFIAICRDFYDFPKDLNSGEEYRVFLFVTDREGDLVSCNRQFMPDALFESAEQGIRLIEDRVRVAFSATRLLDLRHGDFGSEVQLAMPKIFESFKTIKRPRRIARYSRPSLEVRDYIYKWIYYADREWEKKRSADILADMVTPAESPTMCAIMDANGYTIKHLRSAYHFSPSSDDYYSRSSVDINASSNTCTQQEDTTGTLFSLQITVDNSYQNGDAIVYHIYKVIVYHIDRTEPADPHKYVGLLTEPVYAAWCRE